MFILIEAIDGAGKGQQRNNLVSYLSDKVKELTTVDFPDHNSVLYEHIIHPAIHQEIKISPESLFLSFALDQMLWQKKITKTKGSKESYFIADGYYTTAIVYQSLMENVLSLEKALDFADTFAIQKPDIAIYLDVDPEVALQRKAKEEGHEEGFDIYERSLAKQKKIRSGFKKLVNEQIFGDWVEVDGSKSIEGVFEQIITVLKEKKII